LLILTPEFHLVQVCILALLKTNTGGPDMPEITIDANICRKDGLCVMAYTRPVFHQEAKNTVPVTDGQERCFGCGHCVAICPEGAIAHSNYPKGSVHPIRPVYISNYDGVPGLGCFYAGFFVIASGRGDNIARFLSLPETHKIYGALALGYHRLKFKKWPERKAARVIWMYA
jgi:NAD-dependent dihydropyrimidine dehydrogenase PreA subunit